MDRQVRNGAITGIVSGVSLTAILFIFDLLDQSFLTLIVISILVTSVVAIIVSLILRAFEKKPIE